MEAVERKIPARDGVEVVIDQGNICIRQESDYTREEAAVIFVHPDDVPQLVRFLQEAAVELREIEQENLENE